MLDALRPAIAGAALLLSLATATAQAQISPQLSQQIKDVLENAADNEKPSAQQVVPGLELRVYRSADNALVFSHKAGNFNPAAAIEIASATKWVTAATFMALVTDGKLRLDSTTREVLGWEGAAGAITLDQLLSFTSQINEHFCALNKRSSLEACAQQIFNVTRNKRFRGNEYAYGAAAFTVAGRMAEIATGMKWVDIFDKYMRQPLGMSAQVDYWGLWADGAPTDNPSLDGGLRLTVDDYARFMQMIDDKGVHNGRRIIRADLVENMERSRFQHPIRLKSHPATALGYPHFEYGLGNWVECQAPRQCQNAVNSSEGAFGYYPWIDRQSGYYAILAMKGNNRGSQQGGSKRSATTVGILQPALNQAFAGN